MTVPDVASGKRMTELNFKSDRWILVDYRTVGNLVQLARWLHFEITNKVKHDLSRSDTNSLKKYRSLIDFRY